MYDSLVCKFGGEKITMLCRLVKPRVGKTCVMVRGIRCNGVEKESREDMF
ncbi:hypothetical protein HMPREF6745_1818 [Prevotella sp. oral taxon 472 str. F0295]|nr:hypothetical protein HMPREF6745_1818 [Prevotella sp. oral taxon 472 str. F0295]